MAHAIIMPKAGMAMEEGTIVRWLKEVGDAISVGEPILEIETDKVSMEVEAEYDGVLLSKLHDAGDVVAVVTEIGYIGAAGEEAPSKSAAGAAVPASAAADPPAVTPTAKPAASPTAETRIAAPAAVGKTLAATPLAKRLAATHGISLSDITPSGRRGEILHRDVAQAINSSDSKAPVTGRATPLAKKIAAAHDIDITAIPGSGAAGKIKRADIQKAIASPSRASQLGAIQPATTRPLAGVRKIIAERVSATHSQVPPVTFTHPVQIDTLQTLRAQTNDYLQYKTSLNSWLCYAAVRALYRSPLLNCTYEAAEMTLHSDVHLGIAVDSENGLLIPKVSGANRLPFLAFDTAARQIITNARTGVTTIDDLQGATFTVTNLGKYGVTHFTPIIPLPQAAILGLTAARTVCTQQNGQMVTAQEINLLLTVDHRIIDGAAAAQYLHALADIISHPVQLLI